MAKKKSKKPEMTAEEREAWELKQVLDHYINEPTIFYKEGDRVTHGAVKVSHVAKVLEGGKVLKLHETCTENNYGKPFDYERDIYIAWHEISPYKEWDDKEWNLKEAIKKERSRLSYSQRDLESLLHIHYHFGVDFDPDYQRGLVWELEDKVNLIESIFNDVDIGKFVFVHLPYSNAKTPLYEILDGKQRLTALIEFYEGRFKWRGKTYHELHPSDKNFFRHYSVSHAELPERATREQILECFVRLNTGGKPQDINHIEKVKKLLKKEQKY